MADESKQARQKIDEIAAITGDVRRATETIEEYLNRIVPLASSISSIDKQRVDNLREQARLAQLAAETREQEKKDLEAELISEKDILKQAELQLQLEQLKLQTMKDTEGITRLAIDAQKNMIENAENHLEAIIRTNKQQDEMFRKVDKVTGGYASQITQLFGIGRNLSIQEAVMERIGDLFKQVLSSNMEFAQTTGRIAERTASFGIGFAQFGVSFDKLNKSAIELYTSMSSFSDLNVEVQERLAVSATKLGNIGIAAGVTGKNLDILTKGLKMSSDEAIKTNEEIARAAIGAGIAPSKMAEEFGANISKIQQYGKQGIQIYIDMQKQAKSLGMDLSSLNQIVGDQFDTFESSARAAGRYNAILGGNFLNSVEMLNATESERVVLLKKSFEESGKNFDSLSKYEKKAIATSLGIQDLNEASKLFGKTSTELETDMRKRSATEEEMAKAQREATDVMEQLKNIFNLLLIAVRPVVEIFKILINVVAMLSDGIMFLLNFAIKPIIAVGEFFYEIIGKIVDAVGLWRIALGVVSYALIVYNVQMNAAILSTIRFIGQMITATINIISLAATLTVNAVVALYSYATTLLASAIPATLAFIASLRAMGLSGVISAVVSGIGAMIVAFRGMNIAMQSGVIGLIILFASALYMVYEWLIKPHSPPLYIALGLLPPIFFMIGRASDASANSLLKVGAAFLMMGIGVGIAALGLAKLVEAFSQLSGEQALAALGAVIALMVMMVAPLILITIAGSAATIPLLALGAAFLMMGVGIGIAAAGLSLLVTSFGVLADPKVLAGMIGFVGTLYALVPALTTLALLSPAILLLSVGVSVLSVSLLVMSAAFVVIGAAITIASVGIKTIIESFQKLTDEKILKGGLAFVGLLYLMTPALFALSVASPGILVLSAAFLLLSVGIVGISAGLLIISVALEKLVSFLGQLKNIADGLPTAMLKLAASFGILTISMLGIMALGAAGATGFGMIAFVSGLGMMTTAILLLAAALDEIPEGKTVALSTLNETLTTAKTITEDNIKPTKDFIGAVKEYYKFQADSKDADKDALVAALKQVIGEQNKSAEEGQGEGTPIKLVISGNDFAEAINGGGKSVNGLLSGPRSFRRAVRG